MPAVRETNMRFNKEINKFKIALTSACCLRCTHCFIDKDHPENISFPRAEKGLDLLLGSPGKDKILEIYGGEPLLAFGMAQKTIAAARAKARKLGKNLSISMASNGVLVTPEHLAYIAKNNIRFSISFSGGRKTQDLSRRFPSGAGTHKALKEKIPLLLSALGDRLHVIFCVHPRRCAAAYEDFRELARLGFRNIGIECVHGFPWRGKDYDAFGKNMRKIAAYAVTRSKPGDFIVLEPFMEFFREQAHGNAFCPFLRDLEMYPDGALSLYPYPFVKNSAQRRAVAVGSAAKGVNKKFSACVPSPDSPACGDCVSAYYRLPGLSDGSRAYQMRTEICREAVKDLVGRAAAEPAAKAYLKHLIKIFKEGYT